MLAIVYHELIARVRRQALDRYYIVHRPTLCKIEPNTCNNTHTRNTIHTRYRHTRTHAYHTNPQIPGK